MGICGCGRECYEVNLRQVEPGVMFASLADGSSDISVNTVTLPYTHTSYWDEYGDQIDDISISMEKSNTMGLTVPSYVEIDKIEDLQKNTNNIGEKLDWKIVGIDPGSGEMQIIMNKVVPQYGLDEWTVVESSGPAMTAALAKAIDAKEPIVVALWEPHWAFIEWDLKYLEDPKNLFGDPDSLHTVARKGLKEDAPVAYKILEQHHWTQEDLGEVMVMIGSI